MVLSQMIESIYNLGYMKVELSVSRLLFVNSKLINWLTSTCFIQKKHWRHYISLKLLKYGNNMFQINQKNLHLLLPGKISWLVEYLHDDYGFTLQECLSRIYRSELYKKLSTESTKYWHWGPVDLYNELKNEL